LRAKGVKNHLARGMRKPKVRFKLGCCPFVFSHHRACLERAPSSTWPNLLSASSVLLPFVCGEFRSDYGRLLPAADERPMAPMNRVCVKTRKNFWIQRWVITIAWKLAIILTATSTSSSISARNDLRLPQVLFSQRFHTASVRSRHSVGEVWTSASGRFLPIS
jgi:hypothetical protein